MRNKAKKGVLLVQLGTPDSPAKSDVKRYLTQFLMDPRVMDIRYISRTLLVKGIIVPKRCVNSAATYSTTWVIEACATLLPYSIYQKKKQQKVFGDEYHVELTLRYQNPSIDDAIVKMEDKLIESISLIPFFPQ